MVIAPPATQLPLSSRIVLKVIVSQGVAVYIRQRCHSSKVLTVQRTACRRSTTAEAIAEIVAVQKLSIAVQTEPRRPPSRLALIFERGGEDLAVTDRVFTDDDHQRTVLNY